MIRTAGFITTDVLLFFIVKTTLKPEREGP
jgi:hypothetical protein